jgi:hypothetical protein
MSQVRIRVENRMEIRNIVTGWELEGLASWSKSRKIGVDGRLKGYLVAKSLYIALIYYLRSSYMSVVWIRVENRMVDHNVVSGWELEGRM